MAMQEAADEARYYELVHENEDEDDANWREDVFGCEDEAFWRDEGYRSAHVPGMELSYEGCAEVWEHCLDFPSLGYSSMKRCG